MRIVIEDPPPTDRLVSEKINILCESIFYNIHLRLMIAALLYEKLKPDIFKVSFWNQCPKGCAVLLATFKLTICDMIKKQKRGDLWYVMETWKIRRL